MNIYPDHAMEEAIRLIKAFERDNDAASSEFDIPDRIAAANMYTNLAIAHELRRIGNLLAMAQFPEAAEEGQ